MIVDGDVAMASESALFFLYVFLGNFALTAVSTRISGVPGRRNVKGQNEFSGTNTNVINL